MKTPTASHLRLQLGSISDQLRTLDEQITDPTFSADDVATLQTRRAALIANRRECRASQRQA